MFLEAHFGEVELHMPEVTAEPEQGEDSHEPSLLVRLDEANAVINLLTMVCMSHHLRPHSHAEITLQTVFSNNEALQKRVETVLDMALSTVSSLNESFTAGTSLSSDEIPPIEKDKDVPDGITPTPIEPTEPVASGSHSNEMLVDTKPTSIKEEKTAKESTGAVVGEATQEEATAGELAEVKEATLPTKDEVAQDGDESDGSSDDEAILEVHG